MKRVNKLTLPLSAICGALMLVGCGTLGPGSVDGLTTVLGDDLPGAQGATQSDQTKIDLTVARACQAGVYEREKCDEHTIASADRIGQLRL